MTSRKNYHETFKRDRSQVWALVQELVLTVLLRCWDDNEALSSDEWTLARIFSEQELKMGDRQRRAWANANLMELYLLALADANDKLPPEAKKNAKENAKVHAQAFRNVTDLSAVEIHSTRRQVLRYKSFFVNLNSEFTTAADIAQEIAEAILPESHIYA
jgi:hypothetical protein